jgi:DNA-binding transcriptional regulator YiaG
MKAGTFARSTQVPVTEALQARAMMDLSQSQFAKLLGVSVQTPQALLSLA